ncbi:hypothetical protein XcodCFBP4690_17225 [Xanthomonas codiaei]|nr:hypothetical protein XcodCFBP4690_17225 [Xanthomonas codiaei]
MDNFEHALNHAKAALAALQPIGQEPSHYGDPGRGHFVPASCKSSLGFDHGRYSLALYTVPPAPATFGSTKIGVIDTHSPSGFSWNPGFTRGSFPDGTGIYAGQPAPAAVPVDVLREAAALADAVEKNGVWDDGCFYYNKHAASELQTPLANLRRALATHPQPAAAEMSRPPCACHDHMDAVCSEHQPAAAKDLAAMRPRIEAAIRRITSGHGCMRIPAEETDPDLVLADVLQIIDQQVQPAAAKDGDA